MVKLCGDCGFYMEKTELLGVTFNNHTELRGEDWSRKRCGYVHRTILNVPIRQVVTTIENSTKIALTRERKLC